MPPKPAAISHNFHGKGCKTIAKIPVVIHAATSENLFIIGATIAIKVNDIAKVKDHSLGIIAVSYTHLTLPTILLV